MTGKTIDDIVNRLQLPTPPKEISYVPQGLDKDNKTALALPYVDARFVQERLDEACGPFGWQSQIEEIGGFVCVGIGIREPEGNLWVFKWDTGQDKPTEKEDYEAATDETTSGARSLISRGFKRAAVQWGIARDIYDLPKTRRPCYLNYKGGFGGWAKQGKPDTSGTTKVEDVKLTGESEPTGNGEAEVEKAQSDYDRFHVIAKQLGWDISNIQSIVRGCKDKDTGRIDWHKAVEAAEKQVPSKA